MGSFLPITSKLLPFRWRNLVYLAEVAALTRIATGVARVLENRPSKQNDPRMSQNEKRQALAERFFVEILGTMGYMGFLHIGQDLVDMASAACKKAHKLPTIARLPDGQEKAKLEQALDELGLKIKHLDRALKEVYNPHNYANERQGLIYRVLYEHKDAKGNVVPKATLASVQERIISNAPKLKPEVVKGDVDIVQKKVAAFSQALEDYTPLREFAKSNNKWAAGAILTGVGLSAFVGGTVTQWMNDRLVAPHAKHWLNKRFGSDSEKPALAQKINQGLATVSNTMTNLKSPLTTKPTLAQQTTSNPFNINPPNRAQSAQPAIAPVYLPNPKMQPPATAFGAKALPRPYTTPLPSYTSTRLGGSL